MDHNVVHSCDVLSSDDPSSRRCQSRDLLAPVQDRTLRTGDGYSTTSHARAQHCARDSGKVICSILSSASCACGAAAARSAPSPALPLKTCPAALPVARPSHVEARDRSDCTSYIPGVSSLAQGGHDTGDGCSRPSSCSSSTSALPDACTGAAVQLHSAWDHALTSPWPTRHLSTCNRRLQRRDRAAVVALSRPQMHITADCGSQHRIHCSCAETLLSTVMPGTIAAVSPTVLHSFHIRCLAPTHIASVPLRPLCPSIPHPRPCLLLAAATEALRTSAVRCVRFRLWPLRSCSRLVRAHTERPERADRGSADTPTSTTHTPLHRPCNRSAAQQAVRALSCWLAPLRPVHKAAPPPVFLQPPSIFTPYPRTVSTACRASCVNTSVC